MRRPARGLVVPDSTGGRARNRARQPEAGAAVPSARDYIAKLMADRGLKHAEAVTLRKGQASEMIDGLLAMPAVRSAMAAEPTTAVH